MYIFILILQAACGGSYNQNLTYWSTTETTPCTINICKCQEEVRPLRLQQVLIKPRKTAAVHWRQSEGGLLSLVNTKSDHPS